MCQVPAAPLLSTGQKADLPQLLANLLPPAGRPALAPPTLQLSLSGSSQDEDESNLQMAIKVSRLCGALHDIYRCGGQGSAADPGREAFLVFCNEPGVVSTPADPEQCWSCSIREWGGMLSCRLGSPASMLWTGCSWPPTLLAVSQRLLSWHAQDGSTGCMSC